MSKDKINNRLLLDSIFNGIAYSLMTATEKEIQEESKEVFGSVEAGLDAFNKALDRAEMLANKKKFRSIRSALDQKSTAAKKTAKVLSIEEARKRIEEALKKTDDNEKITLAARYGEGIPDEDVLDFYQDLIDLNVLVDEE